MLRTKLTVSGAFDWPRLDHNVNLFWTERHKTQEWREDHNIGSNNSCNGSMTAIDKTFRLVHALSCQLLTDLLCWNLLHNMPCCVHRHGQAFPILRRGTLGHFYCDR